MHLPQEIVNQIYKLGSFKFKNGQLSFLLRNPFGDASITKVFELRINNEQIALDQTNLLLDQDIIQVHQISPNNHLNFPLGCEVEILLPRININGQLNDLQLTFEVLPFGEISLQVQDKVNYAPENSTSTNKLADKTLTNRIPRNKSNNVSGEIIHARQKFLQKKTKIDFQHLNSFSFSPEITKGNIENFTGVSQIPIGLAGPLKINGEHAKGEFIIPLATTEGTLVASYNRGMKVINICGGVTTTVTADQMQRAPVFVFTSSRQARDFSNWIDDHFSEIKLQAEQTSRIAKLTRIESFLLSKFVFLRFNYQTGDAAGQNMVSKATLVACNWILSQNKTIIHFYLEGNFATDKKHSQINCLSPRGKKVVAEVVIKEEILKKELRADTQTLCRHGSISNLASMLAGTNNNGLHSANGLTAMFIATGQDVANIAESSAAFIYAEPTVDNDLYVSLTIPSLIIGTVGGGTGLPTQRECLGILGCYGPNKAKKLAEIMAAAALAGELSLAGAISSWDWISSHERYGRNPLHFN